MAYWDRVVERVSAIPGVEQVALTGCAADGRQHERRWRIQPDNKPQVPFNQQPLTHFVDVGRRLLQHDGYSDPEAAANSRAQDASLDPRVIIINEAMARREFPNEDPIGQRFSFGPGRARAIRSGSRSSAWSATCGSIAPTRSRCRSPTRPYTASPSRAQNLMIRTAGDPMGARRDPCAPRCSRSIRRCRVAAAHARRRGRRLADAAALQHDAADRVRDDRTDPGDRRHLRHGRRMRSRSGRRRSAFASRSAPRAARFSAWCCLDR